ncbi:MAG: DUF2631 domain-containing protein [Mycobacteriaceae bacterium]|nr:DUF2631 domain-containing protein [Mycobacteriaceae bacterium]
MASTEVERHTGVDTAEVPSAEWGWSGDAPRLWHVIGVLMAAFLLLMTIGNHVGHVEDWSLAAVAALILIVTVRHWWLLRRGWIR